MKVIVVTLLLSTLISAQRDADQIKAVMNRQVSDWNAGDIVGYMQGYWQSDQLRFVSNTNVTYGWKGTLERYKKAYASREKMGQLTFSDIEITMLGGNAAVVFGRWSLARKSDNPNGTFSLIFRRIDGKWRIIHDHTSG